MEETMSNQDFAGGGSSTDFSPNTHDQNRSQTIRETASETFSRASDMARDAGRQAKQAAAGAASSVTQNVKEMLDRQLGSGAGLAGHFASSVRLAADDLSRESPMAAGVVRSFADTIDGYAAEMQDKTVDQLARAASDFTRREPALVFGLAAIAGFLAYRTMKSTQPVGSPPIQPQQG
jgi:hypothetical protein